MSVINNFKQVLDTGLENYNAPRSETVCGVKVFFRPSSAGDSVSWNEWSETLESMLSQFDEAGWLEDFNRINIGNNLISGMAVGQYFNSNKTIDLENNVDMGEWSYQLIGNTREHTLSHEFVHHAHMHLNDFGSDKVLFTNDSMSDLIKTEVSYYAGTSITEAIAEIGCGIILGHEFPDAVHDFYEEHDGPMEVYNIGETLQ